MDHQTSSEDREYLQQFERSQIQPAQFHHKEHLKVAYTLLCEGISFQKAKNRLKTGILNLLEVNQLGTAKYHETLTHAWTLAVAHFMHQAPKAYSSFQEFYEGSTPLQDSQVMYTHYTKALIFSPQAKEQVVSPDLDPIPVYG